MTIETLSQSRQPDSVTVAGQPAGQPADADHDAHVRRDPRDQPVRRLPVRGLRRPSHHPPRRPGLRHHRPGCGSCSSRHEREASTGWPTALGVPVRPRQGPLTGKRRTSTKPASRPSGTRSRALRDAIAAHEGGRRVAPSARTVGTSSTSGTRPRGRRRPGHDMGELPRVPRRLRQSPHRRDPAQRADSRPAEPALRPPAHGRPDQAARADWRPRPCRTCTACCTGRSGTPCSWDYLPRNYAPRTPPPRAARTRPRVWTSRAARLSSSSRCRDDRFYALWLLVATTGFRRGELAGLCLQRHRPGAPPRLAGHPRVVAGGEGRGVQTKTSSGERWLALDPTTVAALRDYLATWGEERRLLGQEARTAVRLAGRSAAAPGHHHRAVPQALRCCGPSPHPTARRPALLRHRGAEGGRPAEDRISERLGHATVAFTLQTYSHVIPGMDEEAAEHASPP